MSKISVIIFIIKQNLRFGEDIQDMTTKVMVTPVCSVCGNRTGLYFLSGQKKRWLLRRPKGTFQVSIFDKDRERIQGLFLFGGVPQKLVVGRHLGYGTTKSLSYYIRTRKLHKQMVISKP